MLVVNPLTGQLENQASITGAVSSVNGQTGVVTVTAASVGADVAGTSAAETTRAEGVEATKQPTLKTVTAANTTALFAFTTANVNQGDTVKLTTPALILEVVDITNLGNWKGYSVVIPTDGTNLNFPLTAKGESAHFSYITADYTVTAQSFSGSGASLTGLVATNLTAGGTLPSLNGSALTNLTGANITGQLSNLLDANNNTIVGAFSGTASAYNSAASGSGGFLGTTNYGAMHGYGVEISGNATCAYGYGTQVTVDGVTEIGNLQGSNSVMPRVRIHAHGGDLAGMVAFGFGYAATAPTVSTNAIGSEADGTLATGMAAFFLDATKTHVVFYVNVDGTMKSTAPLLLS